MVTLKSKRQQGFTLVELMVALSLSLGLITALLFSYMSDLKAYDVTVASQALLNKGRITMQHLKLYIQQAGFRDLEQLQTNVQIEEENVGGKVMITGQSIVGWNNVAGTAGDIDSRPAPLDMDTQPKNAAVGSDILAVRFLGASNGIFSCSGAPVTNVNRPYTIYLFVKDVSLNPANVDPGDKRLVCQDATGSAHQILGSQVEHMHFLYGMDKAFEEANNSYRYYNAIEVGNNWSSVDRIKVSILIKQQVTQNPTDNDLVNNNTYTLLDREVTPAADNDFRTVLTETILIKNR